MAAFVDPRTQPAPSNPGLAAPVVDSPALLEDLHRFCRDGHLYEVEAWIQAGRPLQLAPEARPGGRQYPTALGIALDTGQRSLVLLLLCNGYRLDLEPVCPLTRVLTAGAKRRDLVDLLWAWGADPKRVSPTTVFETYSMALFERFHSAGVDFLAHHALGDFLGRHSSNKPLFGWAKRHRERDPRIQVDLNMALREHADEGRLKGALLCLWAGADAHAPARDLPSSRYGRRAADEEEDDGDEGWSAVQEAVAGGHIDVLEALKPDPTRDDFEDLYTWAPDARTVAALAKVAPPTNAGPALAHHLLFIHAPYSGSDDYRRLSALEALFKHGARWTQTTPDELQAIRHGLYKVTESTFTTVLKHLAHGEHADPTVLRELGRAPRLRQRMVAVGLVPGAGGPRDRWTGQPRYEPGAREVATKLGVPMPKPPPPPPPRVIEVNTDSRHWEQRQTIRLTRQELYDRVWAEPVDVLAKQWGLSGRGLAKACDRMRVPVPPRGYWARVRGGQHPRRTPMKDLPGGHPREVLFYLPPKSS